jgi:hypothetical protein
MKQHETQTSSHFQDETVQNDVQPFNNVTDHYHKIMGLPTKRADLSSMPKPVRWFAYFFYTVIVLGAIAIAIGIISQK